MDIRQISDQFSVSPQIAEVDLAALREAGIQSIICNRPDGEEVDQPAFQEIAGTAERFGIQARHIPITGSPVSDADVAAFGKALEELPTPILAYCRTGTRSAMLWSLARADALPVEYILKATQRAGYDMAAVMSQVVDDDRTPAAKVSAK